MPRHKVLALMRVSTKEQDTERQRADIAFHVSRFADDGIEIEIVETFMLEGISGAIAQSTPEFKRMLSRLKDPTISGILISQLDRFLRPENPDAYVALKIFRTGKKLMFCDAERPLDIMNSEDRMIVMNTLEHAAMERRRIKHRTHSKKEQLIQDPTVSVTRLPKGVRHIKDVKKYGAKTKKGWFEYTDFAYSHVKPAMERVAAGESISSVAKALGFSQTALREKLKNRWWIGVNERTHQVIITNDEETGEKIRTKRLPHPIPYVHATNLAEPGKSLVTVELWEKVQTLLAVHAKTFTLVHSNTKDFLFNGLLYCGNCGSKLYVKNDLKRANQPPTYLCSSYQNSWRKPGNAKGQSCGFKRLPADVVDFNLFQVCSAEFQKSEWIEHAITAAMDTDEARNRKTELAAAQERLEGLGKKLVKAKRLFMADDDDEASFKLVNEVKRDIAEAKIRLATAKAQAEPFGTDDASSIAAAIKARWSNPEAWSFDEKRAAIKETIEKVIVGVLGGTTLVIRGGLPMPQESYVTSFEAATINNGGKRRLQIIDFEPLEHAKVSESC